MVLPDPRPFSPRLVVERHRVLTSRLRQSPKTVTDTCSQAAHSLHTACTCTPSPHAYRLPTARVCFPPPLQPGQLPVPAHLPMLHSFPRFFPTAISPRLHCQDFLYWRNKRKGTWEWPRDPSLIVQIITAIYEQLFRAWTGLGCGWRGCSLRQARTVRSLRNNG